MRASTSHSPILGLSFAIALTAATAPACRSTTAEAATDTGPLTGRVALDGSSTLHPVSVVMEWGVRKLDQPLVLRHRSGREKAVRVDLFPAYDEDGGLLASLAPRND